MLLQLNIETTNSQSNEVFYIGIIFIIGLFFIGFILFGSRGQNQLEELEDNYGTTSSQNNRKSTYMNSTDFGTPIRKLKQKQFRKTKKGLDL